MIPNIDPVLGDPLATDVKDAGFFTPVDYKAL